MCLFNCVYPDPNPISVPPPLPSNWCITCDTYASVKQQQGHGPWLSRAYEATRTWPRALAEAWLCTQEDSGTPAVLQVIFVCGGSIFKWALGWALFLSFKQVIKEVYILQARVHSLLQALPASHQGHQAHASIHELSEAWRCQVWAWRPCFELSRSVFQSLTLRPS